jgi:hypothetical protein
MIQLCKPHYLVISMRCQFIRLAGTAFGTYRGTRIGCHPGEAEGVATFLSVKRQGLHWRGSSDVGKDTGGCFMG